MQRAVEHIRPTRVVDSPIHSSAPPPRQLAPNIFPLYFYYCFAQRSQSVLRFPRTSVPAGTSTVVLDATPGHVCFTSKSSGRLAVKSCHDPPSICPGSAWLLNRLHPPRLFATYQSDTRGEIFVNLNLGVSLHHSLLKQSLSEGQLSYAHPPKSTYRKLGVAWAAIDICLSR